MLLNFTLFYSTLLSNSNSNFNSNSNSIFTLVSLILSTSYFLVFCIVLDDLMCFAQFERKKFIFPKGKLTIILFVCGWLSLM